MERREGMDKDPYLLFTILGFIISFFLHMGNSFYLYVFG